MTKDELIAFEESIAADFNAAKIPYPVHLESGNEEQLIEVFKEVKANDWVFTSWRGHLKALLKGVPSDDLRVAIYRGESMGLKFPEHRVYGSAIVGGNIPIALGVALGIKRRQGSEWVYCFIGDMTALTGIFSECCLYAVNFSLPIKFIIEDNNLSVCTDTVRVWGNERELDGISRVHRYEYESKWPHCGSGTRVNF